MILSKIESAQVSTTILPFAALLSIKLWASAVSSKLNTHHWREYAALQKRSVLVSLTNKRLSVLCHHGYAHNLAFAQHPHARKELNRTKENFPPSPYFNPLSFTSFSNSLFLILFLAAMGI